MSKISLTLTVPNPQISIWFSTHPRGLGFYNIAEMSIVTHLFICNTFAFEKEPAAFET